MSKLLLKDKIELLYGFSIRVNNENSGRYPVFGSNGITGYIDSYKVDGPGVIIGRKGSVGAINFSEEKFTPTDTTYYLHIKDKSQDDIKFWYFYLQLLGLDKLNTHSSVPGLSREVAYLISVNPPKLNVQQKIASILSMIDTKIELNNRINEALEAMAKTIYDYWFVQFDFPDENGKPYKSSGGRMVWNEELKKEIPEGWTIGGFDHIGDIIGGSTPSKTNSKYFTNTGIPWITPKDLSINRSKKFITRGESDLTELGLKNASLKILPKGTVLLSSRAPIGYIAISRNEVTTNQGFKSLVPKKPYSTEFIYYTVQLYIDAMIQYASGSTFSEISGSTLKMIKIVIPDTKIVKKFTEKIETIFLQQDLLEKQNDELIRLRDWLLPMLMNGQVRVN